MQNMVSSFQPINTPKKRRVLLKPMNCPHHCEIYNVPWSYKDLPKRYAEFGTVYRYEQSGEWFDTCVVLLRMTYIFCTQNNWMKSLKK
jgi:threonyl-tRNA synthetase